MRQKKLLQKVEKNGGKVTLTEAVVILMATAAEKLASNLNFGALGKASELRNRLLFTLGALLVFRLGTFLPIPGINPVALQQFFEQQSSGILGIFDTFSGGALGRMGIFALGVMPYISASIIMTLMQSSIPSS